MENLSVLGTTIKEKRLSLNMRMDDLAKKANITRATLWSIEKGNGNYSITSLFNVMTVLGLSFNVESKENDPVTRNRASRTNTCSDKKINRFVIMCVEQYSNSVNKSSRDVYKKMSEKGVIKELTDDYEDLHGMSSICLNEYIGALLGD